MFNTFVWFVTLESYIRHEMIGALSIACSGWLQKNALPQLSSILPEPSKQKKRKTVYKAYGNGNRTKTYKKHTSRQFYTVLGIFPSSSFMLKAANLLSILQSDFCT